MKGAELNNRGKAITGARTSGAAVSHSGAPVPLCTSVKVKAHSTDVKSN